MFNGKLQHSHFAGLLSVLVAIKAGLDWVTFVAQHWVVQYLKRREIALDFYGVTTTTDNT